MTNKYRIKHRTTDHLCPICGTEWEFCIINGDEPDAPGVWYHDDPENPCRRGDVPSTHPHGPATEEG